MAEEVYKKIKERHKYAKIKRQVKYRRHWHSLFYCRLYLRCLVRIFVPYTSGFPINDGGLFYKMIEGIQSNNYRLPENIQYNGLTIPFAYHPLGFYFAALVSDLFKITLIEILRWLPALTLIVIIPAIYILSNLILNSRFEAGLASLMYALTPGSITWQIMGGGVTRSLGQFFLLLAISNIFYYSQSNKRNISFSPLFSVPLYVILILRQPFTQSELLSCSGYSTEKTKKELLMRFSSQSGHWPSLRHGGSPHFSDLV